MPLLRHQQLAKEGFFFLLKLLAAVLILASAGWFILSVAGCKSEFIPSAPNKIIVGYTGSMRPTFKGGEIREVIHTPFADLKAGQIVLTWFLGDWHPHRLVSKHLGRWKTKGDSSPGADNFEMTDENYGGTILP